MELQLTDTIASLTLPLLEVPLTESIIENSTDVVTLDANIYTDFITTKRSWTHTWTYMNEDDYDAVRAFYNRQFTEFKYPLLTIPHYSIANVPVRMTINDKSIINSCGRIGKITITFRETLQI